MKSFSVIPYKLFNTIQNYDWGTKNDAAFIPHLLGIPAEPDLPYGELWIGAHPKASSKIEVEGTMMPLNHVIRQFPQECLGTYVRKTFSDTFPFLLKVLSAARALSIQTHPDKAQAEQLHARDPKNYPDDNHKPEVAIAIDSLIALAGFKPLPALKENLKSLPELVGLIGGGMLDEFFRNTDPQTDSSMVKSIYAAMMQHAEDAQGLTACISNLQARLAHKPGRTKEEEQFLRQYELYGADVGLLSFFFFNLVELKPGEAIFTDAGVPHAYIQGTICECMANSDNVVRAGLTGKFKDVPTLLNIVRYDFAECPVMKPGSDAHETRYRTSAKEFEVARMIQPGGFHRTVHTGDRPAVYLVMKGTLQVKWNSSEAAQTYKRGESFFIPASLGVYELASDGGAEFFAVTIP